MVNQSRLPRTMSCQTLNISTGGDSTAPVENLFQDLTTLTRKSVMFIVSCPVNEQCPFFSPSHQVLTDIDELPCPESSPLRLQSPSSLSLSSMEKCISASILLALCWIHSSKSLPLVVWEPRSEHCTPGGASSVQSREEPVVHQDPQCFFAKLLFLLVRPQPIPGTWVFFLSSSRIWLFPSLTFVKTFSA